VSPSFGFSSERRGAVARSASFHYDATGLIIDGSLLGVAIDDGHEHRST
jgi:hypothetical protein